jgi:ferredoxin
MVVADENNCMVELARYFLHFTADESCGKCTPCREGTRMMLHILNTITAGEGTEGDLEMLETLAHQIKATALCGLGRTAPNPVLTTLRYFRDEYRAHIEDRRCPAHECRQLNSYRIDTRACTGCGLCRKECPAGAISGRRKGPHRVDQKACVKCGICFEVCQFGAVTRD